MSDSLSDILRYFWDEGRTLTTTPVYTTDGKTMIGGRYSFNDFTVYLNSGWQTKIKKGDVLTALSFYGGSFKIITTAFPSQQTRDGKTVWAVTTQKYIGTVPTPGTSGGGGAGENANVPAPAPGSVEAPPTSTEGGTSFLDAKFKVGGVEIPVVFVLAGAVGLAVLAGGGRR